MSLNLIKINDDPVRKSFNDANFMLQAESELSQCARERESLHENILIPSNTKT